MQDQKIYVHYGIHTLRGSTDESEDVILEGVVFLDHHGCKGEGGGTIELPMKLSLIKEIRKSLSYRNEFDEDLLRSNLVALRRICHLSKMMIAEEEQKLSRLQDPDCS